jgi:hypothetical protein
VTEELMALLATEQERVILGAGHRYRVDGKPMANVTTIAKVLDAPQLDAWKVRTQVEGTARAAYESPPIENEPMDAYAARLSRIAAQEFEHERISKAAADDGTQVHALIEYRLRKMLGQDVQRPKVSEEAAFREAGWEHWAKDVKLRPLLIEARVAHRELRYCGTLDLLAEVEGKPTLWDWKRSKRVWESHHLQSIAYRMALESIGWPRIDGYVLLMPEGQEVQPRLLSNSDETREAWLSCLRLYRWKPEKAA